MKTIAKVIDNKSYQSGGKDKDFIDISIIDTPVPAIIHYPNTQEYTHGEINRVRGLYSLGAILEIESTFHQAGEVLHGHTITHDCYSHNIKVIG